MGSTALTCLEYILFVRYKDVYGWTVVVHDFKPSTWEAKAGRSLSWRLAWSIEFQTARAKEKNSISGQRAGGLL